MEYTYVHIVVAALQVHNDDDDDDNVVDDVECCFNFISMNCSFSV